MQQTKITAPKKEERRSAADVFKKWTIQAALSQHIVQWQLWIKCACTPTSAAWHNVSVWHSAVWTCRCCCSSDFARRSEQSAAVSTSHWVTVISTHTHAQTHTKPTREFISLFYSIILICHTPRPPHILFSPVPPNHSRGEFHSLCATSKHRQAPIKTYFWHGVWSI